MSTEIMKPTAITPEERALLLNDLKQLNAEQRSALYRKVCESVGLNPLTQPFQYLELNGKLVFYASRNCTDQLRQVHGVSLEITKREKVDGVYVVTAKATTPAGRCDESTGAVDISEPEKISIWENNSKKWVPNPRAGQTVSGDALANALMKAETKAKRRVTLSICGLSYLDESELEMVKGAKVVEEPKIEVKELMTATAPQVREHAEEVKVPDIDQYLADNPEAQKKYDTVMAYKITFGRFLGKRINELGLPKAKQFADALTKNCEEKKLEMSPRVVEYCDMVKMAEQLEAELSAAPRFAPDMSEQLPEFTQ